MSRKFPNFFENYCEWAANDFVPQQFNEWACLSIIAGAVERKVWLQWNDSHYYFPNLYLLFVSKPGEGKTSALQRAVRLLHEANRKCQSINIMPNQSTEAKFLELMGKGRSFQMGTQTVFQNAGYYYAPEASSSLCNIYGGFIEALTDLYDNHAEWSRATKKDGVISLKNVCVNLFAASTFDYLGELVSDKNIMGGFASRLIYVLCRDKPIVAQKFQEGSDEETRTVRKTYETALVHDLLEIHKMTGPLTAEANVQRAWETWWLDFETKRKQYESEKLQSLLVRTNNNILKTAMLLCIAESDDRVIRLRHWERAHGMVMKIVEDIPNIFRESRANATEKNPRNLTQLIFHKLMQKPGMSKAILKISLISEGYPARDVDQTIDALMQAGQISAGSARPGGDVALKVLGNPNDYL